MDEVKLIGCDIYLNDLSNLTEKDILNIYNERNDFDNFKFFRQNDFLNFQNHYEWYCNLKKDKTVKMYSIRNIKSELIGVCGITSIDLINQRAEFSMYIFKKYRLHGFGKTALVKMIKHVFNCYPINIIWGEVIDGNPTLIMFKSIGFKEEGIRRDFYFKEGQFKNAILISIKKGELIL